MVPGPRYPALEPGFDRTKAQATQLYHYEETVLYLPDSLRVVFCFGLPTYKDSLSHLPQYMYRGNFY